MINHETLLNLRNAIMLRVQSLKPAHVSVLLGSNGFQGYLDMLDPDLSIFTAKTPEDALLAFDIANKIIDTFECL